MSLGRLVAAFPVVSRISIFNSMKTGLPPQDAWRLANFETMANTGDAADNADSDGDALVNLIEFAFGTNPEAAGSGPGDLTFAGETITARGQPVVGVMAEPNGFKVRVIYGRRKDAGQARLTYDLEYSADMKTWAASTFTPSVVASDFEMEAVRVSDPAFSSAGGEAQFFRIRVTQSP